MRSTRLLVICVSTLVLCSAVFVVQQQRSSRPMRTGSTSSAAAVPPKVPPDLSPSSGSPTYAPGQPEGSEAIDPGTHAPNPSASPAPSPKEGEGLVITRRNREPRGIQGYTNWVAESPCEMRQEAASSLSRWLAIAHDAKARPGDRGGAIRALQFFPDLPEARDLILAAFHDPEPGVRNWATQFQAFRDWGDVLPRLVSATLALAQGDPDESVRHNARQAVKPYVSEPSVFESVVGWLRSAQSAAQVNGFIDCLYRADEFSNEQLQEAYDVGCVVRDRLLSKSYKNEEGQPTLDHVMHAISNIRKEASRSD